MTEENEEEVSEQERNAELARSAFRRPGIGINERLVCQSLFQGTFTDIPEKKINHLCVAALNCDVLMKKDTENKEKPFDIPLIEKIYSINLSFQHSITTRLDQVGNLSICVPWAFEKSEENHEKYVLPWSSSVSLHYWESQINRSLLRKGYKINHSKLSYRNDCKKVFAICLAEEYDKIKAKIIEEWRGKECPECGYTVQSYDIGDEETVLTMDKPEWKYFFGVSQGLGLACARELKNRFYSWAVPILERTKMVVGSYVNPQTYQDVIKLLGKTVEKEEKHLAEQ